MFDFSPIQIIVVLAIALAIFGPKRLPELGRNLGRGLRDFKRSVSGEESESTESADTESAPADDDPVEPERIPAGDGEDRTDAQRDSQVPVGAGPTRET